MPSITVLVWEKKKGHITFYLDKFYNFALIPKNKNLLVEAYLYFS